MCATLCEAATFHPRMREEQQVCLLHHGQQQYAIPSTLIDNVIQLRSEQARDALARRVLEVNGRQLLLPPLHSLLDEPLPVLQPSSSEVRLAFPLLIKNGDELMVIVADHVSWWDSGLFFPPAWPESTSYRREHASNRFHLVDVVPRGASRVFAIRSNSR